MVKVKLTLDHGDAQLDSLSMNNINIMIGLVEILGKVGIYAKRRNLLAIILSRTRIIRSV